MSGNLIEQFEDAIGDANRWLQGKATDAYGQRSTFELWAGPFSWKALQVLSFEGTEGMSRLYSFKVRFASELDPQVLEPAMLGQMATFSMIVENYGPRVIQGIVGAVALMGTLGSDSAKNVYSIEIVPRAWILKKRRNSRIFQDKTVKEIVSAVLDEAHVTHHWQLKGSYPKLRFCTQYQETDYDFVKRMLAEFGIYFYFKPPSALVDMMLRGGGAVATGLLASTTAVVSEIGGAVGSVASQFGGGMNLVNGYMAQAGISLMETMIFGDEANYPGIPGGVEAGDMLGGALSLVADHTQGLVSSLAAGADSAIDAAVPAPELVFRQDVGMNPGDQHITKLTLRRKLKSKGVALREFDFQRPGADLKAEAVHGVSGGSGLAQQAASLGSATLSALAGATGLGTVVRGTLQTAAVGLSAKSMEVYEHHRMLEYRSREADRRGPFGVGDIVGASAQALGAASRGDVAGMANAVLGASDAASGAAAGIAGAASGGVAGLAARAAGAAASALGGGMEVLSRAEPPVLSRETARVHLAQFRARAVVAVGKSGCRRLAPGHKFALTDHAVAWMNTGYVVTRVTHRGALPEEQRGEAEVLYVYQNEFECVPAMVSYRPARPKRTIRQTLETAIVVGTSTQGNRAAGRRATRASLRRLAQQAAAAVTAQGGRESDEIFTDQHGRVKVKFHWDREGQPNAHASCWIRVAQPWSGSRFGFQFIPRVGTEVLVSFLSGDPDQPVVIGGMFNQTEQYPYALPLEKTRSGIRSRSTPNGQGYNELSFEDAIGSEQIRIHAQRDMDEHVLRNHTRNVDVDERITVAHDRKLIVGHNNVTNVGNDDITEVAKNQTLTVTENRTQVVRGDSSQRYENNSSIRVAKKEIRDVVEDRLTTIRRDDDTRVFGTDVTMIGKHNAKRSQVNHVEGMMNQSATEQIELQAEQGIIFRCGESTITLEKKRVVINAPTIQFGSEGAGMSLKNKIIMNSSKVIKAIGQDGMELKGKGSVIKLDTKFRAKGESGTSLQTGSVSGGPESGEEAEATHIELKDQNGNPVPYARYELIQGENKFTGLLGKDGKATIFLRPGSYDIRFPGRVAVQRGGAGGGGGGASPRGGAGGTPSRSSSGSGAGSASHGRHAPHGATPPSAPTGHAPELQGQTSTASSAARPRSFDNASDGQLQALGNTSEPAPGTYDRRALESQAELGAGQTTPLRAERPWDHTSDEELWRIAGREQEGMRPPNTSRTDLERLATEAQQRRRSF